MRPFLSAIAFLFAALSLAAQQESKDTTDYLYNASTMSKLKLIVDSLNLKHRQCDLDRVYYSRSQAIGHYVVIKDDLLSTAESALKDGMTFEKFTKTYTCEILTDLVVVKSAYPGYENGEKMVDFEAFSTSNVEDHTVQLPTAQWKQGSVKGKWIWQRSGNDILAIWFVTDFSSVALSEKYARMVQYSDCMIDTSTVIMHEDGKYGLYTPLPENYESLSAEEKAQLLEKLRSTSVMGGCSRDSSPRYHARNIAIMAAETVNWGVFLRAHLNIMNDRFQRMAYSNYGERSFQTHIGELEALDIDVQQLLLGISLQIENPANNHYFGSIQRVGRALSETRHADEIEQGMIAMISDKSLDHYNRVAIYYLFKNYNSWLSDGERKIKNEELLKTLVWKIE